jgi:hypothetical protein
VTKNFENMWKATGMPSVIPMFATTATDMRFFNEVVLETCKEMAKKDSKYEERAKEAETLYEDALNNRQVKG